MIEILLAALGGSGLCLLAQYKADQVTKFLYTALAITLTALLSILLRKVLGKLLTQIVSFLCYQYLLLTALCIGLTMADAPQTLAFWSRGLFAALLSLLAPVCLYKWRTRFIGQSIQSRMRGSSIYHVSFAPGRTLIELVLGRKSLGTMLIERNEFEATNLIGRVHHTNLVLSRMDEIL